MRKGPEDFMQDERQGVKIYTIVIQQELTIIIFLFEK